MRGSDMRGSTVLQICRARGAAQLGKETSFRGWAGVLAVSVLLKTVINSARLTLWLLGLISRRLDYLVCLSKMSKDVNGQNNEADFHDWWRGQISMDIQRCNAKISSKKLSKLSLNRLEDFLYDRDIQHHVH